jgi:arylsulfatase A-like enzyme
MKKLALAAGAIILLLFIVLVLQRDPQSRSRVVLITIDTVRYDHLGGFGYSRDTSPNIDGLALSGVKFTNCFTTLPKTDPAHVSMLTSSYPRTHGVLRNGMEITNPDVLCLAQWLKGEGYATAAITARVGLEPKTLKLEGFDYAKSPKDGETKAPEIYKEAITFIDEHPEDDFFLWVHFFDAHTRYRPPAPYDSMFNDGFRGYIDKPFQFLPEGIEWTEEEIDYNVSLYDGEIRYMDHYIGKLLDHLYGQSPDAPLIILAADHGETLGELHDRFGYAFDHGEFLYNPEIRIPLILSWKGMLPEGKAVDSLVESIDIAPTIVDLLFGKKLSEFWGISLKNLIFDASTEHKRYAFAHRRTLIKTPTPYLVGEQIAVMSQDYKLIYNAVKGSELYELSVEELPRNDLSAKKPEVVEELLKELGKWREKHEPAPVILDIPPKKKEQLKALGYLF